MIEGISEAASENTQKPERDEVITSLITMLHGEEAVNHEKGEAASDIPVKRKRGRPPIFEHGWSQWDAGSKATTKRGQLEALYARRARYVLFEHRHKHPELTEWTGLYRCEDGREILDLTALKTTVLAELGRLIEKYKNGEEVAVQWSVKILNMKPKPSVKKAMRMLRGWRLGDKRGTGSADALTIKILSSIDSYTNGHPNTTEQQIIDALEQAIGIRYEYYDDQQEEGDDARDDY